MCFAMDNICIEITHQKAKKLIGKFLKANVSNCFFCILRYVSRHVNSFSSSCFSFYASLGTSWNVNIKAYLARKNVSCQHQKRENQAELLVPWLLAIRTLTKININTSQSVSFIKAKERIDHTFTKSEYGIHKDCLFSRNLSFALVQIAKNMLLLRAVKKGSLFSRLYDMCSLLAPLHLLLLAWDPFHLN